MSYKFKVWDIVRRTWASTEWAIKWELYEVSEVNALYDTLILKWYNYGWFSAERFELHQPINHIDYNLSKSPAQFLTLPIMSMNYFHTAVLIKSHSSSATSIDANYKELVPYAVRTAKNIWDMRDTLVRELKKGIETSDCQFLISNVF